MGAVKRMYMDLQSKRDTEMDDDYQWAEDFSDWLDGLAPTPLAVSREDEELIKMIAQQLGEDDA